VRLSTDCVTCRYVECEKYVTNVTCVTLGARRFGIVEVVEGLEEGELVVSEGIVKLRDGSRVRFSPESKGVDEAIEAARAADTRS